MVAREPLPVHPVANHPFHVAPTLFAVSVPKHVLVPVYVTTSDFANHTCLDLLVGFHIRTFVMTLSTGDDTQVLGLCLLGRSHDGTITLRVYGNRFFQERVLALLGSILEMKRTEHRRSSQDNHVYTRINHLLVSIETYEAVFCRYFLIIFFLNIVANAFYTVGKYIAQSVHLDAIGCFEQVGYGTITATTTTNQTHLKLLAIDSLVRQFRYIEFTRLLQRSQLIAIATCRDQCRCSYQTTYTDYRRSF